MHRGQNYPTRIIPFVLHCIQKTYSTIPKAQRYQACALQCQPAILPRHDKRNVISSCHILPEMRQHIQVPTDTAFVLIGEDCLHVSLTFGGLLTSFFLRLYFGRHDLDSTSITMSTKDLDGNMEPFLDGLSPFLRRLQAA